MNKTAGCRRPLRCGLYLSTYFEVFNVHLPLLHAPSFDSEHQASGLLFAMSTVGALYRLERRVAALLYRAADAAMPICTSEIQNSFFHSRGTGASADRAASAGGNWHSLAYHQARLILHYVRLFGGNSELAERSLGMIAELLMVRSWS